MKVIKCLLVSMITLLSVPYVPVNASSIPDVGYTKDEIASMSDDEYVSMIANFSVESEKEGHTFEQKRKALEKVGVDYENESKDIPILRGGEKSSSATLLVSTSKRSGQKYCYTTASVIAKERFTSTGSEDVLSIEWATSTYDSSGYYGVSTPADGHCTYMDGTNRTKGIVLFNLDDDYLNANGAQCFASVLNYCSGQKSHKYAAKYVHTYESTSYTWNIGGNINYSEKTGAYGGLSFTVSGSSIGKTWQLYATS